MAIGLGISRRDSWLVSEDISARTSLEVAVTNGFSYLQCVVREVVVSPGEIDDESSNLHCKSREISRGIAGEKFKSSLALGS